MRNQKRNVSDPFGTDPFGTGGAGDDDLLGDTDWVATRFEWSVTDRVDGSRYFYPTSGTLFPVDGGNDVIYAGAGNDWAVATRIAVSPAPTLWAAPMVRKLNRTGPVIGCIEKGGRSCI